MYIGNEIDEIKKQFLEEHYEELETLYVQKYAYMLDRLNRTINESIKNELIELYKCFEILKKNPLCSIGKIDFSEYHKLYPKNWSEHKMYIYTEFGDNIDSYIYAFNIMSYKLFVEENNFKSYLVMKKDYFDDNEDYSKFVLDYDTFGSKPQYYDKVIDYLRNNDFAKCDNCKFFDKYGFCNAHHHYSRNDCDKDTLSGFLHKDLKYYQGGR